MGYSSLCYDCTSRLFKFANCSLRNANILAALRAWLYHWRNKNVAIACDNLAVVQVLASDRTRDLTLAAIARNI